MYNGQASYTGIKSSGYRGLSSQRRGNCNKLGYHLPTSSGLNLHRNERINKLFHNKAEIDLTPLWDIQELDTQGLGQQSTTALAQHQELSVPAITYRVGPLHCPEDIRRIPDTIMPDDPRMGADQGSRRTDEHFASTYGRSGIPYFHIEKHKDAFECIISTVVFGNDECIGFDATKKIRRLKLSAPSRPSRTPKRLRTRRKTQSVSSLEGDGVLESHDSSSSYLPPNIFSLSQRRPSLTSELLPLDRSRPHLMTELCLHFWLNM
ncbi:uncharacterized protein F5147DRAFT_832603 [Suillus discolor]|uniref:Uncharacterized protein n=1 Tax=Suillus discolor TaxID=1912936 RepID=A0A9P7FK86_9AGAM|nr:uncharacterized protein F5147DRAFT_832603 [Suillus discolor]KAG2118760.1 hypothetical protein F5147DRAFT_832603 [Suillus discolor]